VAEARVLIEAWRVGYNTLRRHSALQGAPPEQCPLSRRSPAGADAGSRWKEQHEERRT